jgi:hypothetical protein
VGFSLSHGTSLVSQVSLGTLGKLLVQHDGISSQSSRSKSEEGQGELLSTSSGRSTPSDTTSSLDGDLTTHVINSRHDILHVVADGLLVPNLVIVIVLSVVVVVGFHGGETVGGFTLASGLVEVLANLSGLGLLVLSIVVVLSLLDAGCNTLSLGEDGLELVVGELHVTIVTGEHVVYVHVLGEGGALVIGEHTNLDTGTGRGAHGSGVVNDTVVVVVLELLALNVLGGIKVTICFHVVDVLALLVTGGGVDVLAIVGVVVVAVVVAVLGHLVTRVAGLAHVLLLLLDIFSSGLEVGVKVNKVLSEARVATAAGAVGAQTEDHKPLGLKEVVHTILSVIIISAFLPTSEFLDELTLLEFDGVAGQIDVSILLSLKGTNGLGSTNEFGGVGRFGVVGTDLGGEGVGLGGSGESGSGEEGDDGELHVELFN